MQLRIKVNSNAIWPEAHVLAVHMLLIEPKAAAQSVFFYLRT
jgi:hypothetical protein